MGEDHTEVRMEDAPHAATAVADQLLTYMVLSLEARGGKAHHRTAPKLWSMPSCYLHTSAYRRCLVS